MNGPTKSGTTVTSPDWPMEIYTTLLEVGVVQASYVPDAAHSRLIELLHADPDVQTTVLTTEEGFALSAGAVDHHCGRDRDRQLSRRAGQGYRRPALCPGKDCPRPRRAGPAAARRRPSEASFPPASPLRSDLSGEDIISCIPWRPGTRINEPRTPGTIEKREAPRSPAAGQLPDIFVRLFDPADEAPKSRALLSPAGFSGH